MTPFAQTIPSYTKKDRPGKQYSCGCSWRRGSHPYCQNCMILLGVGHWEEVALHDELPVVTDDFDKETGVWTRGRRDIPGVVCLTCYEDKERGIPYTLRLTPVEPSIRRKRVEEWAKEQGIPAPRGGHGRHIGGFTRE